MSRILAKYVGPESDPGYEGYLTPGRIYLAQPSFEGSDAVDMSKIHVVDDEGQVLTFYTDEGVWEFPDKAYAVALTAYGTTVAGEVLELLGGSDDDFLHLKNRQGHDLWHRKETYEILDSTNVTPGNYVMALKTGRWHRIRRVEGTGWFSVHPYPPDDHAPLGELLSPLGFRFPISNDELASEPLVRCADATGETALIEGKVYRLAVTNDKDGTVIIVVSETEEEYLVGRFTADL
jgi:hypothetical protein